MSGTHILRRGPPRPRRSLFRCASRLSVEGQPPGRYALAGTRLRPVADAARKNPLQPNRIS